MIQKFIDRFIEIKEEFKDKLKVAEIGTYADLVKMVVENINDPNIDPWETGELLDPERIHEIDDGDYQGVLVYVIGRQGYQPSAYCYVMVGYGSCSGCDTLQSILYSGDKEQEADELWTLALHIVEGLKEMQDDYV